MPARRIPGKEIARILTACNPAAKTGFLIRPRGEMNLPNGVILTSPK
jgi:hypothetical protein